MLDRKLPLVAGDEERAGFEPRHRALAQGLQRRVVDRLARVAVDDAEHLPDRPAAGFGDRSIRSSARRSGSAAARCRSGRWRSLRRRSQPSVVLSHSRWPRNSMSAALRSRSARRTAPIVVQANTASTRMLSHGEDGERRGAVVVGVRLGLMGEPADDERQHEDARQQAPQHLARRRLLDDGRADAVFRRGREQAEARAGRRSSRRRSTSR